MRPMHATLGKIEDINKKDFIFEPKLDGYRALCYINSKVRFISRNNRDLTKSYPEIQFKINCDSCVLDGEIVVFDEFGKPDFNLLQNHTYEASYIIFDILKYNGKDITSLPLIKRKEILEKLSFNKENIDKIAFTQDGKKILDFAKEHNLEGVMAKKISSIYEQRRSKNWIKIKFTQTADCIILGYKKMKRDLSSLILGVFDKTNIIYIGEVGTGFNDQMIKELLDLFEKYETNNSPIKIKEKNIQYLKPELVCEVKYSELTKDNKLRAPVFLRLRNDKSPEECKLTSIKPKGT